jgi:hypothetical protein
MPGALPHHPTRAPPASHPATRAAASQRNIAAAGDLEQLRPKPQYAPANCPAHPWLSLQACYAAVCLSCWASSLITMLFPLLLLLLGR